MVLASRLTERSDVDVEVMALRQGRTLPFRPSHPTHKTSALLPTSTRILPAPAHATRLDVRQLTRTRTEIFGGRSSGSPVMLHPGATEDYIELF